MTDDEIETELLRTPFVPFRFHLNDGRTFDVPHRNSAHLLPYGVLVLLGLREGTHSADGYDRFPYEAIRRIEFNPPKRRPSRRRKAS